MPDEFGRLLTVADVAAVLNVDPAEVTALIQSGELPAIQLNNREWRIERNVLRGFIDGKYEEARRSHLWEQVEFLDLPELTRGRPRRPRRPH